MNVLTVHDHPLDHEVFVVIRGHNASVIAGKLDGRIYDVQSPAGNTREIYLGKFRRCKA